MARESIERLVAADDQRYRRQMAAWPTRAPIVDHDPGDEDRSLSGLQSVVTVEQ